MQPLCKSCIGWLYAHRLCSGYSLGGAELAVEAAGAVATLAVEAAGVATKLAVEAAAGADFVDEATAEVAGEAAALADEAAALALMSSVM